MFSSPSLGDIVHPSVLHHRVESNMRYWRKYLTEVDANLATEPARIADFYSAKTTRIDPVGIVFLWPA